MKGGYNSIRFIKRLFKNLWKYLFLPIGVISIFSAIIGTITGVVVCIAILPNLLLTHSNIQSHLLDILSLFWLSSVLGIFIVINIYFNQEEKVRWYILLLHGILLGCLIPILFLCANYPILILYVVLTIIVIAVIVIIIKTIKE
ncbi:membrane protein [Staphylococcus phage Twillingate]|nr:membrane protein [Staphylococcus phage Twillingate]